MRTIIRGQGLPTEKCSSPAFTTALDNVKRSFYTSHMDMRAHILATAEQDFDNHGFAGTGMDRLTASAKLSSRTLYKHIGNKTALIAAVLEERRQRFRDVFDVESIDALFASLERWTKSEGARGCLFFRARAEMGDELPEISAAVAAYRQELRNILERSVANDVDQADSRMLTEQLLVLFEGATSAASYRGVTAVSAARAAAAVLLEQARRQTAGYKAQNQSSQV
jgi:AcrR family transcriptional regulator